MKRRRLKCGRRGRKRTGRKGPSLWLHRIVELITGVGYEDAVVPRESRLARAVGHLLDRP